MKSIDIHQANVVGLGAEKFASGVIQELVAFERFEIKNVYINKKSPRKKYYKSVSKQVRVNYFLGLFSRLVEILMWRFTRDQKNEILVLGDLPLNTSAKQYVLCHQSLMFKYAPRCSGRVVSGFFCAKRCIPRLNNVFNVWQVLFFPGNPPRCL